MSVSERRRDPLWRWIRIVRARPRLFLAGLLGLAVAAFLPAEWRAATRSLVGWDVALTLYLGLAFRLMTNSDANHIRRRAALLDEGRFTVLALTVGAAMASLIAILAELGGANRQPAHLVLAAVTILLSWAFTHTISPFTMLTRTIARRPPRAAVLTSQVRKRPTIGILSTSLLWSA